MSCEAIFEPAEWKAVYRVVRREPPPREPPKLKEMVRLIAQLGGYVNKPDADDPGSQTVWLGLARTHDFAHCWQLFGPEAKKPTDLCGTTTGEGPTCKQPPPRSRIIRQ